MKTLSISLYNRPNYTKIVLDSLNKCFGIDEYSIFIHCEPSNNEVIELAKRFRPDQTKLIINSVKYGCNKNIYHCLKNGFDTNNYHIHFEDDTVPGKDCLRYFEWAGNEYEKDNNIFSVTSYSKFKNKEELDTSKVLRNKWFTPWGWATWVDRWREIDEFLYSNLNGIDSWDLIIDKSLRKDRYEIYPLIARTQNIGAELGTYCPNAEWHKDNQYNEFWIESLSNYTTKFIEYENI